MRTVVFGATGIQGSHQLPLLVDAGHTVVAISRNPTPLTISGQKIETLAADFTDPTAISHALEGADTIFLNLPSTSFNPSAPILTACSHISRAAKQNGVKLIVFNTSMPIPLEPQGIKAQDDRREMRRLLRESGVPVISIEPVVYLDNLLEGWALPPIRDSQILRYCHKPELEVSWITHRDVAQLMVAASQRPELAGRNFAVGGPETVTLAELGKKLSTAWGRDLAVENQTVADFCDKIGDQMDKAYTYYNEAKDRPFKINMGPVLEELPVKLTTIEEWARTRKPPGW
ncbi:hypothetical protein B0J11DRAFT_551511 [Dendryphion nanum]|uniref:NmrA-like domain-containing protein n=1 Tax=Dendryphion nanum TaxID=256645 RepID=A0A9P9DL54_9PLEO|nr:hypothetical protein B0J11DRAFT_551511 [Dendryphion nanum]